MSRPSSPTRVATMTGYSPSRNRLTASTCFACFRPVSPALPISIPDSMPASASFARMTSTESRKLEKTSALPRACESILTSSGIFGCSMPPPRARSASSSAREKSGSPNRSCAPFARALWQYFRNGVVPCASSRARAWCIRMAEKSGFMAFLRPSSTFWRIRSSDESERSGSTPAERKRSYLLSSAFLTEACISAMRGGRRTLTISVRVFCTYGATSGLSSRLWATEAIRSVVIIAVAFCMSLGSVAVMPRTLTEAGSMPAMELYA